MYSKEATVKSPIGLHSKTATQFIMIANTYDCMSYVERNGKKVPGKSLLGIMSLGVVQNDTIVISADGDGAEEAVNALCEFVESGK